MRFQRGSLSFISFQNACHRVSAGGGALLLLTPDKGYWRDLVNRHCLPCTTVYIRDPVSGDGPTDATHVLVDAVYPADVVERWLRRVDGNVDRTRLKGSPKQAITQ